MAEKSKNNKKNKKHNHSKKDAFEVQGELLYKKNHEEINSEDVYHEPKVPGRFAGDC